MQTAVPAAAVRGEALDREGVRAEDCRADQHQGRLEPGRKGVAIPLGSNSELDWCGRWRWRRSWPGWRRPSSGSSSWNARNLTSVRRSEGKLCCVMCTVNVVHITTVFDVLAIKIFRVTTLNTVHCTLYTVQAAGETGGGRSLVPGPGQDNNSCYNFHIYTK